jgi:RNA polymerase sigma-70 factor (ECF subfamily)
MKGIESNPETFESLINSMRVKLYKTAMAILKNDDDACDAIQETLMSAYKNFNSLNNKSYFGTWITRILINKCYDIIKQNKKISSINQMMEKDENASYYDVYKEESLVENVLSKIDPDLKVVTVLYYYDEFSVNEIAEMLNIPEGTVKSRLSRSRDKLYDILKKEEGESIG